MSTVLELLVAARAVIADEKQWTRYALARNRNGLVTTPNSPTACKWCGSGAVWKVVDEAAPKMWQTTYEGIVSILTNLAGEPFNLYNDTHKHAEVLALFDKAIEGWSK